MNTLNFKRQIAGFMFMGGGGGGGGSSGGGGSESGGNAVDGSGYSSGGGTYTDDGGVTYQFNGGNTPYGSDYSASGGGEPTYQSNGGQPMYGADSDPGSDAPAQTENYQSNNGSPMYGAEAPSNDSPAQTGNYQNFGMPAGNTPDAGYESNVTQPVAREQSDAEKALRFGLGFTPLAAPLNLTERIGKFFQPGGSLLKSGEVGGATGRGAGNYKDEDGNEIQQSKKTGLINSMIKSTAEDMAKAANNESQQEQQSYQNNTAPQAATPANAGGSVDASMYGNGSGWGASIAKFNKAKQGAKL